MKRHLALVKAAGILLLATGLIVGSIPFPMGEATHQTSTQSNVSSSTDVLVVDPQEHEATSIINYILGRNSTFWSQFNNSYSDIELQCVSPTENISNYSPDVIVVSDSNIKLWELNTYVKIPPS